LGDQSLQHWFVCMFSVAFKNAFSSNPQCGTGLVRLDVNIVKV